jgi:hypothetical protein
MPPRGHVRDRLRAVSPSPTNEPLQPAKAYRSCAAIATKPRGPPKRAVRIALDILGPRRSYLDIILWELAKGPGLAAWKSVDLDISRSGPCRFR